MTLVQLSTEVRLLPQVPSPSLATLETKLFFLRSEVPRQLLRSSGVCLLRPTPATPPELDRHGTGQA